MKSSNDKGSLKVKNDFRSLIRVSSLTYSLMALIGFEICWWYHKNAVSLLGAPQAGWRTSVVVVVASILFLHLTQSLLESYFPTYRKFKESLAETFSGLGFFGVFWLALASSIAEEIFFRGALQPFLGLWLTSVLFGLLHLDPERGISVWTGWAVVAGIIFGAIVKLTGSLWPAIVIHFVINFVGIRSLSKLKSSFTSPSEESRL